MINFFRKTKEFAAIVNVETKKESAPHIVEKRIITVQEIHDEVDSLEDKFLEQVNHIISSGALEESREEKKSKLAQELGFVNSSVVRDAEAIVEDRKSKLASVDNAELLRVYKQHYPLDKIITVSMFEDVCEKYGLIIAPVENYIKDIPEKNLLELKNSKPTIGEHYPDDFIVLSRVTFMHDHTEEYQEYINSFIGKDVTSHNLSGRLDDIETNTSRLAKGFSGERGSKYFCNEATFQVCTKKGLYVSAPPSHLRTEGLRQLGKHHLRVIGIIEEDPIVFEYLKGDLIRIRTKWGTPDDQSYLDENIVNQELN
jgi:hypothetical protein